ncbi:MAG: cation:proton antiporter [Acidimicrobiales bacterium]
MDIAETLQDILIVLVAAKAAAELAERVGIPAVVGEIVAGILIGPSLLNAVGTGDEVLRTLGEIGVILLLLDVGLEMDLGELAKVGRASMFVAVIGVVAPMALGIGAMELIGDDFKTSLFVGAALTATSVGITARVFGDLRALATTEARIVLGAAVADDVMGLVVLTVVVRVVTEGSVSVLSVVGLVVVAVAFLVLGGLIGLRVAPPLFAVVDRFARSTGTLVAIALAFTLGFAELAHAAKLAPIVGAFVAGIALSKAQQAGRIRRELAPVGHLFIPVFFLQIGIDADVGAFFRGAVLRDAAILLVVAVVGKLVASLGAIGSPGDKVLIGLGMLPRGEVGLIFATLGLQNGVLDDDLYAALLLVVLVTTLVTPQLLKARYAKLRAAVAPVATPSDAPEPDGGWLNVTADEVGLAARPPDELALPLTLRAAQLLAQRRPTSDLLDWLADANDTPVRWTRRLTNELLDVIERGNARSWRFLHTTGLLDRALPEIAVALRDRADPVSLDPLQSHRFASMERLRMLDADDPIAMEIDALEHVDRLLLAAWLIEACDDEAEPARAARATLARLDLDDAERRAVEGLVADRDLLWSAAHQPGGLSEEPVLQLATHLDTPEQARALYVIGALRSEGRERWELERLRELHALIQSVLADDGLSGVEARGLVQRRKHEAAALLGDSREAARRVDTAPRAYVLRQDSEALARHARLLDPSPSGGRVRVAVVAAGDGWWVDVAARDRPALLAAITRALADASVPVLDAVLATWDDGAVVDSFLVAVTDRPDEDALRRAIEVDLDATLQSQPLPGTEVEFDQTASPWHTVCEIRSTDRPGLLCSLATAFAAAGVEVRSAKVSAGDGLVIDRFEVVDRDGAKLGADVEQRVRDLLISGVTIKRRRFGRRLAVKTGTP